jgi:hypothetical protein
MSLSLDLGTKPKGLEVKTYGIGNLEAVYLGDYEISMEDFLIMAEYVLTNSDLKPNDQRLQFIKCIKSMQEVEGWNENGKRLQPSAPPILR